MRAAKHDNSRRLGDQHVERHASGWVVSEAGQPVAGEVFPTQRAAIASARARARSAGARLVIHGRDGRVRQATSYADDAQARALDAGRSFLRRHRVAFERLSKL